jgi:hypothetical protein
LTTRETFLSLQATLFVQCVRVLSHGVGPHSVGWPLCDFGGDARLGQTKRRERGRCRSVPPAKQKKRKKKKPLANASSGFAPSAATHLGLFFQPDVAVLEQPVEVVRAHGFRFPLVRVVHEVLHAAHRRDGAHDDGEGRERLERLRLVSGDDGATERTARREGARSALRGEAFRVRAVTRAETRVRTKTRDFPRRVVVARSAPRPSRGS